MKKEMKVLLSAAGLFMLAGGLFGPIYAVFVEEIGGDLLTAGGAYAVFAISAGVLIYFISRWEDRVKNQEILIILGYVCSMLGFGGYLLVREPWHLFMVQVIFGIGEAIGTPAYDGVYSRNLEKGKFASQWGLWETMAWILAGISAFAGGVIAEEFGFQILFIVMFILSIIGLFVSFLFSPFPGNCA